MSSVDNDRHAPCAYFQGSVVGAVFELIIFHLGVLDLGLRRAQLGLDLVDIDHVRQGQRPVARLVRCRTNFINASAGLEIDLHPILANFDGRKDAARRRQVRADI